MFKRIYWWYHRKKYSYPCRSEVEDVFFKYYCKDWNKLTKYRLRYRSICVSYCSNRYTLEGLATAYQCTRERMRQILLKICRDTPTEFWYNRRYEIPPLNTINPS